MCKLSEHVPGKAKPCGDVLPALSQGAEQAASEGRKCDNPKCDSALCQQRSGKCDRQRSFHLQDRRSGATLVR
jgi:hypothetical protein